MIAEDRAETSQDAPETAETISPDVNETSDSFDASISKALDATENREWAIATKRFDISPLSRKALGAFREEFKQFQKDNPDVIGATVYGSQVKGTATEQSDIDSYVFFDVDKLSDQNAQQELQTSFRQRITSRLGLTGKKLKDIQFVPISKERIDNQIDSLLEFHEATKRHEYPKELPENDFEKMFHLQMGRGLDPYRKYVLDNLATRGASGEWLANFALSSAMDWEGAPKEKQYLEAPKSISAAKKYFRVENTQPKFPVAAKK